MNEIIRITKRQLQMIQRLSFIAAKINTNFQINKINLDSYSKFENLKQDVDELKQNSVSFTLN